jgi:hypothetical protein
MVNVLETSTELVELGRFLAISARRFDAGDSGPEMFGAAIDAAWHTLLQDPAAYTEFATEHAGRTIGHSPAQGEGFIGWVAAYEEAYGPLPEIWFTDTDGTVDTAALDRYRETGKVWARWDCTPVPGDGDDVTPQHETATR